MFLDYFDKYYGNFLTQVPLAEFASDMALEEMSYELLRVLNGGFCNSKLRWLTVDKKAFASDSKFRRLDYQL